MYLTIAERQYNQKLVFVFLQEVAHAFKDELRNTYGSANNIDYLSKVETIENQYAFLKFGKWPRARPDLLRRARDPQEEKGVQGHERIAEFGQAQPGADRCKQDHDGVFRDAVEQRQQFKQDPGAVGHVAGQQ